MQLDPEAAEAIRNLVGRYSEAVSRLDLDEVGHCWARDGVWTVFGRDHQGRDAIVAEFRALTTPLVWVVQHASGGWLRTEGAEITGIWQVVEYGRRREPDAAGDVGLLHIGRYVDRYIREDGAWQFAARRFETIHGGPLPMPG